MRWLEGITDAMDLNLSKFPKIGEDRGAGQVQFMESRSQTQQLGSNSPWPADGGRTPLCLSNQAPGHKLIKSGAPAARNGQPASWAVQLLTVPVHNLSWEHSRPFLTD